MTAREPLAFAAFGELFERIGPRCVEQAVARDGAVELRRDQRFRDEIGKTVGNFRGVTSGLTAIALAASSPKAPAKIARRRRITPSGSGKSS
jgi:hypothetical protein